MNRHPPHRSDADLRPVFLVALALYVLVSFGLVMALGVTAGAAGGPLHPTPGLGL